jgi:hypothetical protein
MEVDEKFFISPQNFHPALLIGGNRRTFIIDAVV